MPGAGRWRTVLLADGNIGIGGDPAALLRRVLALLGPGGRVLAEVDPPGTGARVEPLRLRSGRTVGEWFPGRTCPPTPPPYSPPPAPRPPPSRGRRHRWFVALHP